VPLGAALECQIEKRKIDSAGCAIEFTNAPTKRCAGLCAGTPRELNGMPSHVATIQAHRRQRHTERGVRLWYGASDNDQSSVVLTLTAQYVANALQKALPVTLEEMEEYAQENEEWLRATRLTRKHVAKPQSSCIGYPAASKR
jgi:hypothetical protein